MKRLDKGWLSNHLTTRKADNWLATVPVGLHPDKLLYAIIQPTGLIYGRASVGSESLVEPQKVILDSFCNIFTLISNAKGITFQDNLDENTKLLVALHDFYKRFYPEVYKARWFQKHSITNKVEHIINARASSLSKNNSVWAEFFISCQFFVEFYFFKVWIQTEPDEAVADYLKTHKDKIQLDLIKVIASAAHSNHIIEKEERELFNQFILSDSFPKHLKKEASLHFEEGVDLDNLSYPEEDSWLLNKFYLELAILTTFADRKIEEIEESFLKGFNANLELPFSEYNKSMISIQGFVIQNWSQMGGIKNQQDYDDLLNEFLRQIKSVVYGHQDLLIKKIKTNDALLRHLHSATTQETSDSGQQFISKHLLSSIQTLPDFELIKLPEDVLTLPMLMKILPSDFFKNLKS